MNRSRTLALLGAFGAIIAGCSAFEVADDQMPDHGDEMEAHDETHEDSPPIDGAPEIAVTATSMTFDPATLELSAGEPVNLAVTSDDILHDLTVDEVGFHVVADVGETTTGGIELDEPGEYTAYCSVAGHREAGMELDITVR